MLTDKGGRADQPGRVDGDVDLPDAADGAAVAWDARNRWQWRGSHHCRGARSQAQGDRSRLVQRSVVGGPCAPLQSLKSLLVPQARPLCKRVMDQLLTHNRRRCPRDLQLLAAVRDHHLQGAAVAQKRGRWRDKPADNPIAQRAGSNLQAGSKNHRQATHLQTGPNQASSSLDVARGDRRHKGVDVHGIAKRNVERRGRLGDGGSAWAGKGPLRDAERVGYAEAMPGRCEWLCM